MTDIELPDGSRWVLANTSYYEVVGGKAMFSSEDEPARSFAEFFREVGKPLEGIFRVESDGLPRYGVWRAMAEFNEKNVDWTCERIDYFAVGRSSARTHYMLTPIRPAETPATPPPKPSIPIANGKSVAVGDTVWVIRDDRVESVTVTDHSVITDCSMVFATELEAWERLDEILDKKMHVAEDDTREFRRRWNEVCARIARLKAVAAKQAEAKP